MRRWFGPKAPLYLYQSQDPVGKMIFRQLRPPEQTSTIDSIHLMPARFAVRRTNNLSSVIMCPVSSFLLLAITRRPAEDRHNQQHDKRNRVEDRTQPS